MRTTILTIVILSILFIAGHAYAFPIFEEHFSGSGLPVGWNYDTDGIWSVENGELSQARTGASPGHADCLGGDINWTDYSMQTRFQFIELGSDSMEAGVIIRSHNNPIVATRVSWRGSSWNLELVRASAPEIHLSLNQNLTTGQWYTMKSQIEGNFLKVWVNDSLYDFGDISYSPNPIPSYGRIGLWANKAHVHFDDVLVDNLQPAPEVVPEPATMTLFGIGAAGMAFLRRRKAFKGGVR